VLIPEPSGWVQAIDARDLAQWLLQAAERDLAGVYNTTGPTLPLRELLETIKHTARSTARFVRVREAQLLGAGVSPWSELPLWLPGPQHGASGPSTLRPREGSGHDRRARPLSGEEGCGASRSLGFARRATLRYRGEHRHDEGRGTPRAQSGMTGPVLRTLPDAPREDQSSPFISFRSRQKVRKARCHSRGFRLVLCCVGDLRQGANNESLCGDGSDWKAPGAASGWRGSAQPDRHTSQLRIVT
jgi:hypothetical protein